MSEQEGAGEPVSYRRMTYIALIAAVVCSGGIGIAARVFGIDPLQTLVIAGLYWAGCLPGILYLNAIAKTQQRRHPEPER